MKASIDIGSNTVLLLVGEQENDAINIIDERQQAPRLGKGVDNMKNLDPDSMQRVLNTLQEYKNIINRYESVNSIRVVATSAVRDAKNREEFIRRVQKKTGLDVQILSGDEEAKLTYLGAKSVLEKSESPVVVIDIGGGSTEIAWGRGDTLSDYFSFDIGSVRFTERYLKSNPPTDKQLTDCKNAIRTSFNERGFYIPSDSELIGVAGTVTSLAAIKCNLQHYEPAKIKGQILTIENIGSSIAKSSSMPCEKLLEKYPNILEGRADVFLAGLLILEGFMDYYHFPQLVVSTGGIRHGAFFIE